MLNKSAVFYITIVRIERKKKRDFPEEGEQGFCI